MPAPTLRRLLGAALGAGCLALALPGVACAAPPVGGELLASQVPVSGAGAAAPPAVAATSYVVADADTGAVLAAKAAHRHLRPASTLKTLAAITLQPRIPAKAVYTASEVDERIEGSKAGMVKGGTYTAEQLFLAMFLRSGNDATHGLAMLGGGVPATVAAMNAEARRLQALDTHAVTPEGLDEDGQLSSAYDLALIARVAVANPTLVSYATTMHARFPGKVPARGPRPGFQLWSEQKFVVRYPGAIGLKNGYTTLARNTLVTAARRGGHTVIVTLMDTGAGAWKEAAALSDWYFAGGRSAAPVGQLVAPLGTPGADQPAVADALTAPGGTVAGAAVAPRTAASAAQAQPEAALLGSWRRTAAEGLAALAGLVVLLRVRVLVRARLRRARRRRQREVVRLPAARPLPPRSATRDSTPSRA
ncbi:D-alanyl-D-alanine carboxypeptidase (penicillin-binding protein 5/6) [Motilibacter peucedani]|uniref:D-alanyl-D-alanine carboxypeptidase (Penicillin-binding protein 5/6) n=1 Tax=Motilibacter peucedani TaxID=598650 RepID=A0A420XL50_9ACTN|nr:D-alanyl-D-alanine carboxypeptidase [Motilibacter peucedani]RKS69362.1 D-alanyl-D-alanine carboxypeptidase (penicillin-binding protein 5/6) [Motilibacter peucedani]